MHHGRRRADRAFIGSTSIRFDRVFSRAVPFADNVDAQIFLIARLPRALAAALVGATLAAAGVVFQGLLRNPLATPYTLGVSAGASLGAMIAITFGQTWRSEGGAATSRRMLAVSSCSPGTATAACQRPCSASRSHAHSFFRR